MFYIQSQFSYSFQVSYRLMEVFPAAVCIVLWFLKNALAQDFYVVAPSALRLNYDETVAIAIDGSSRRTANVMIKYLEYDVIFEKNVSLLPGKPQLVKVYLNSSKFNDGYLSDPTREKIVSLKVCIQSSGKEILIPISNQAGYMLVQSAKPVYTPRERAIFTITPLTEDGLPSHQKFKLQIKNPQGEVVTEKVFNDRRKEPNYFVGYSYLFSKYANLGKWEAVVRYGPNLELSSSTTFHLLEYVLPRFTVKIKTPAVILPTNDAFNIDIEAHYAHGKPVKGVVSLQLNVQKPGDEFIRKFTFYGPTMLEDGTHTVRISTKDLKDHDDVGWFPMIEGSVLLVEATVMDHATGNTEVKRDTSTRFSISPYQISFKRSLTDFKPGFLTTLEADITTFDGKPASGVPVRISGVADNRRSIIMAQNYSVSDENGKVAFEIHPGLYFKTITWTLETNDLNYGENQAKGTIVQNAYQSKNEAYIAISSRSPVKLEPGDLFVREVHFEPRELQNLYYVVVARGKIVLMDKVHQGAYRYPRLEFHITYSMAPSFRVIVFAHNGNDLIADSLKFEVEKICDPKSEVNIETVFSEPEPGNNGEIILKGENGTYVYLYGIDEAVYAIDQKDLLSREMMFDKLDSHDLGCGPGGGLDVYSVLGNAGITVGTNKFSPLQAQSCIGLRRKKRSFESFQDSDMTEADFEGDLIPRRDFRELWIDKIITINNGEYNMQASLPHTITTWVLQAVSVNPTHGICVAKPQKIVAFKKVFLEVNIPYSIKLFEQVEVEVTVFNHGDTDISAYVYMYGMDGICSGTESGIKSEKRTVLVGKKSAETVAFPIVPLRVQHFHLTFVVLSVDGQDKVEKILRVLPPGISVEKTFQIKLDPTDQTGRQQKNIETEYYTDIIDPVMNFQLTTLKLNLPNDTVPGTAVVSIAVSGEPIAAANKNKLSDPDKFFKQPLGNGEHNMVNFAPSVYAIRCLKATNQLTQERERKGIEFVRAGYNNELNYKKEDGSYSVWPDTQSSTWLTAFVLKVFCQARHFMSIDDDVISSGIEWLVKHQEADGSFVEKHKILNREIMGGVDDTISMTAFVLIALTECQSNNETLTIAKQLAIAYLEDHVLRSNTDEPLTTAILAYAMALSDSYLKQLVNNRLISMVRRNTELSYLYWTKENSVGDIETTSYGLLTQLLLNDGPRSNSIANWLKERKYEEYASTQDLVIALQALAEFAIKTKVPMINLISNITSSNIYGFYKVLTLNSKNALEVEDVIVAIDDPDKKIFIFTDGYGIGTLSVNLRYNVLLQEKDICKFDVNFDLEEIRMNHTVNGEENLMAKRENDGDTKKDYKLKLQICVKYLGNEDADMSIIDVGLFSGFEPVTSQLDEIVNDANHLIYQYKTWNRGIVFYLEQVPSSEFYCFAFEMRRKYIVGHSQSSVIKVYIVNNPDETCTKFYSPNKKSALINTICDSGVCECAEGKCPGKEPFTQFMDLNPSERRGDILSMFCYEYDYVWTVKLIGRMRKVGEYLNLTVHVEEVLKAGLESKESIEGNTRTALTQYHCDAAYLLPGTTYLIVGRDPLSRILNDGVNYQYFLNSRSIIYPLILDENADNEELLHDLEIILHYLKNEGCEI